MQTFERLEKEFGEWVGYTPDQMVAVASGTAALHLALEAMKLPEDLRVIVPDFTMIACPRAVTMAGLTPTFVDCRHNLTMSSKPLALANRPMLSVGAIMYVHIYGRRCQIDEISDWVSPGLYVIEDMAEIHGVNPHPDTDAACWSFYRNKIIAGEEGGMIAFKDSKKATLARQLRSLGFTDAHDFQHVSRGVNARMSNAHAGLIFNSFYCVQENMEDRRQTESWYDEVCPPEWRMPARDAVWVYDVRIPGLTYAQQTQIVQTLNAGGIAARLAFKPMSSQKEYSANYPESYHPAMAHPNAYRASREVLYLPVYPGMTAQQCSENIFALMAAVDNVRGVFTAG